MEDGSGDDACGGVGDDDGDVGDDDGDGIFQVERQSCKRTVAWLQWQKAKKQKANGLKQALHGSDTKDFFLPLARTEFQQNNTSNKHTDLIFADSHINFQSKRFKYVKEKK